MRRRGDAAGVRDLLDGAPVELGPAIQLGERRAAFATSGAEPCFASSALTAVGAEDARALGALVRGRELGAPRLERAPALVVDEAELAADRHQAIDRVVLAQQQPELGARRQHAIRLLGAARDQIVDEHADVRLIAAQDQRIAPRQRERRVDAGEQALDRGLLVAATCR